jgi:predicted RNA-binding Zn-ribbon protein involved in translation (DUF1610 family)
MIRSSMNDIKRPPEFVCECGFEGLFTPDKCPKCGKVIKKIELS